MASCASIIKNDNFPVGLNAVNHDRTILRNLILA